MKKILFKSGSTMMGGLEKVQIEYINFLVKNGYEIRVIIENDNGPKNEFESMINHKVEYLKSYNYISKIKKAREDRKKNIFSAIKYNFLIKKEREYSKSRFLEIYNEFQPNIVIDFDSSLTRFISKLDKSKNIVWIHSSIPRWKKKKRKIDKFTKQLEGYDKVICICKEMVEELKEINPKLEDKAKFIYNPIDFERVKELSKEGFIDEELKDSQDKFLLTVARLDLVPKDFKTLFEGFDIAKENGYDGKLYVIGDGPDRKKVEELRKKSKYKDEILLLGRKINPYKWMAKADKFIMSSKYEGYPTVLLEALTLESEIISSNCKTGPKEILGDGKVGSLFEIGDKERLGEQILSVERKELNDLKNQIKLFESDMIYSKFLDTLEEKDV